MFKFKCGDFVKDKVTNFKGIIISRSEYLTGCNRYALQSKELYQGKPVEWQHFDEDQLEEVKGGNIKIKSDKSKGGYKPIIKRNYK